MMALPFFGSRFGWGSLMSYAVIILVFTDISLNEVLE